jgi:hypothetical protein
VAAALEIAEPERARSVSASGAPTPYPLRLGARGV